MSAKLPVSTVMGDLQEMNSDVPSYAFTPPAADQEANWQAEAVTAHS